MRLTTMVDLVTRYNPMWVSPVAIERNREIYDQTLRAKSTFGFIPH